MRKGRKRKEGEGPTPNSFGLKPPLLAKIPLLCSQCGIIRSIANCSDCSRFTQTVVDCGRLSSHPQRDRTRQFDRAGSRRRRELGIKVCLQHTNQIELEFANYSSKHMLSNGSMGVFTEHEPTEHQPSLFRCSQSSRDADARDQ